MDYTDGVGFHKPKFPILFTTREPLLGPPCGQGGTTRRETVAHLVGKLFILLGLTLGSLYNASLESRSWERKIWKNKSRIGLAH